ncbi:SDR family oxidoreductase [Piscinibacter sp.]|uniref:SDR family oxidoreductase n=1 Tax=Piscinibacter sp. TaxID=1903157 RepID=UPI0039E30FAF
MAPPTRPVVLVTGAARRIGRVIALDLAAHGHDIALHCHRPSAEADATRDELRALGARAEVFAADLADEAACRALLPAAAERFGRVDALVNNASRFAYDDAASFGHAEMERHWRVNAAAPVLLARALHEHLAARDARGCVVNLLDQKLANPNPDYFSYTLSKAALQSATAMLAQALAPRLRVCAVAPGVTLPSGDMDDADFAAAQQLSPLRRGATPEDIAAAARYLLGAHAVTGATLLVDGGQHLAAQPRDVAFLVRSA